MRLIPLNGWASSIPFVRLLFFFTSDSFLHEQAPVNCVSSFLNGVFAPSPPVVKSIRPATKVHRGTATQCASPLLCLQGSLSTCWFGVYFCWTVSFVENDRPPSFQGAPDKWDASRRVFRQFVWLGADSV